MKWFDYASPASLGEALKLLAQHGKRARLLAGGTDLLVQMRSGRRAPEWVIDVKNIPELSELSYDSARGLTLGAAVPCYRIYGSPEVVAMYPALNDVASLIGGTQIQGRASIGGNLCNAAPSADAIPPLIALDAKCRMAGPEGEREIEVGDFCTGPGKTVLAANEILVSIQIPPPKAHSGARYIRFIPRNEMDIAVAGAGVSVQLENGNFRSARIALAAVAPTPLFVKEAGEFLAGKPVSDEIIEQAAAIAREAAKPITDMRGTVAYRKHISGVLTKRALRDAVARAKGAH